MSVQFDPFHHPMAAWMKGSFLCPGCQSFVSLADREPLAETTCDYCGQYYYVPKRIGKFWLYRELGGGGMGHVFEAFHQDWPEKHFAVKVLPPTTDEEVIGNLEEEARIMSDLRSHTCIANSVASGEENGEHYIAMDYVLGERMDHKIARLGRICETEMILIMLRLLAAETHIYSRGYLYRDMKPQNVILTQDNGPFLYDFGICCLIEEALDDSAELIAGTPLYFPPERLTGEGENVSSEIYSLGMVLYNGLTGRTFFTNREIEAMTSKEVLPASLQKRDKMAGISPDLTAVIQKMIQRHPKKRYQKFIEVERDLLKLLWVRIKRDPNMTILTPDPQGFNPEDIPPDEQFQGPLMDNEDTEIYGGADRPRFRYRPPGQPTESGTYEVPRIHE